MASRVRPDKQGCTYHVANRAHPRRDKAAVRWLADAHGQIHVVLQKIERPITQHQARVDLRIGFEEFGDRRYNMPASEDDWCSDNEFASRGTVFARHRALCLADIFEDALARREIRPARLGQRQLARGSIEKAGLDMRFELGNFPADGGQRHSERAASSRQAARLDNRDEYGHGLEPIHTFP